MCLFQLDGLAIYQGDFHYKQNKTQLFNEACLQSGLWAWNCLLYAAYDLNIKLLSLLDIWKKKFLFVNFRFFDKGYNHQYFNKLAKNKSFKI